MGDAFSAIGSLADPLRRRLYAFVAGRDDDLVEVARVHFRLGERLQPTADIRLIELPLAIPPLREKLIWSPRYTASPAHAWFRERLVEVADAL